MAPEHWDNRMSRILGAYIGVPAPLHTKMNDLVHRVERGEVKPSAELIAGW